MKLGILWDLDGTLLETLEDLKDAVNYMLHHYGLPQRSLSEIRSFVGNGAEHLVRTSLPGTPADPDPLEALSVFKEYYGTHCQDKTRPYDGIPEVLAQLAQKYPMAVVSNKPDPATKDLCAHYFPTLYAQGQTPDCPRKPAPDMVHKTTAVLGIDHCIYIGDSEVDVATAKNAGVPCLSVLWGFRDRSDLEEAGAQFFCANPKDLPTVISTMEEYYGL